MKNLKHYHQPAFYLVLIPFVTIIITMTWTLVLNCRSSDQIWRSPIFQNRYFYTTAGILALILPFIHLLNSPYLMNRLHDILLGGLDIQLYYYPVMENLNNSLLFGVSTERWYCLLAGTRS